ncbi:hypothetical protein [Sphingomonas sanxanigenens]|uniref:hypothetical protein n=1 Tax=Sphingomonas sanxanigenens TaxID=397260 RepID=UPI001300EED3|nr:hypothetical protein [Sphingomonas sanxanigenens]
MPTTTFPFPIGAASAFDRSDRHWWAFRTTGSIRRAPGPQNPLRAALTSCTLLGDASARITDRKFAFCTAASATQIWRICARNIPQITEKTGLFRAYGLLDNRNDDSNNLIDAAEHRY